MTVKLIKKIGAVGAMSLALSAVLVACGGADPTDTPRPTNTPMPTAMMEATAEPTAMAPSDGDGAAATAEPARPTSTPRPTAPPPPVDPGFDAAAYFEGKTIRLMVGFSPGGGTDAQARYMAQAWPKFIPGNPRIVVTNRTPVLAERNFVWNSKPDGLTLSVDATPGIYDMVEDGAQFDMREVTMIGVTSGKEGMWVRRTDRTESYDCIDSAFGASGPELTIGTPAPSPDRLGAPVIVGWLADQLNVPLRILNIPDAFGSAQQYLMLERGDVNSWMSGTLWDQLPRTRPDWLPSGFIKPFADLSVPGFDLGNNGQVDFHCPNVADAYLDGEQVTIYRAIREPQISTAKSIHGPPGIPNEITVALRDALANAMADEEFSDGLLRSTSIKINFTHGNQAQQDLIDATNTFFDNRATIDAITEDVFEKYVR